MKKRLDACRCLPLFGLLGGEMAVASPFWPFQTINCPAGCPPGMATAVWTETGIDILKPFEVWRDSGSNAIIVLLNVITILTIVIPWITDVLVLVESWGKKRFPPRFFLRALYISLLCIVIFFLLTLSFLTNFLPILPSQSIGRGVDYLLGGIFISFVSNMLLLLVFQAKRQ